MTYGQGQACGLLLFYGKGRVRFMTAPLAEVQVGQRPIAIHGLEPLGTTDRRVIICWRQSQRSMRAV
jgi:hypothetical protein